MEVSHFHHGHMTASNNRYSGLKMFFPPNHSKAERRKVESTVTIDPCLPITLGALLTFACIVTEQKRQKPQVMRENQVAEFVNLRMLWRVLNLICGSILVYLVSRNKKEEKVMDRPKTTWITTKTHLRHIFFYSITMNIVLWYYHTMRF